MTATEFFQSLKLVVSHGRSISFCEDDMRALVDDLGWLEVMICVVAESPERFWQIVRETREVSRNNERGAWPIPGIERLYSMEGAVERLIQIGQRYLDNSTGDGNRFPRMQLERHGGVLRPRGGAPSLILRGDEDSPDLMLYGTGYDLEDLEALEATGLVEFDDTPNSERSAQSWRRVADLEKRCRELENVIESSRDEPTEGRRVLVMTEGVSGNGTITDRSGGLFRVRLGESHRTGLVFLIDTERGGWYTGGFENESAEWKCVLLPE